MNPTRVTWELPDTFNDGSPFTPADLGSFEVSVDGGTPVNVGKSTEYVLPTLAFGSHTVTVVTIASNGAKSTSASVTFAIVDGRVPNPPKSLLAV